MIYKYGDICIEETKIGEIIDEFKKSEIKDFSTADFIEKHRKCKYETESRSVGNSWNAHLGKILSQYAQKTNKINKMNKKDSNGAEMWKII